MKSEELLQILESDSDGKDLKLFLRDNPHVLLQSLKYKGNPSRVISDMDLGWGYVADFIVLAPISSAFEIKIISIGPPVAEVFDQLGKPTLFADEQISLVSAWKRQVNRTRPKFLRNLDRAGREKDLIREHNSGEIMTSSAGWELNHPNLMINIGYDIVLGRQSKEEDEGTHKKANFNNSDVISLVPCDIFLKGTAKIDEFREVYTNPLASHRN